ncbi:MAG: hypothetical protein LM550_17365 [Candidatus Contendobacter sp.]|nr:hypothetical protein [Gammaproteobacteria bacterium]MCC8995406.1 hypothetical protein [Candidatus Contendobacter sp.]
MLLRSPEQPLLESPLLESPEQPLLESPLLELPPPVQREQRRLALPESPPAFRDFPQHKQYRR